jgi:heme exporter protein C
MYIHVPAAWNSMFIYGVMALSSLFVLVWRIKAAAAVARACAPLGAMFTFLALATGSLWGKPMWGSWWVWDARLTSELILLFLYLGFMALQSAIEDKDAAARAAGVLAIVGIVNIPIIHYSVEWWNTLHQGATVSAMGKPKVHWEMFIPLMLMTFSFKFYFGAVVLRKARNEMLEREQNSQWVKEMLGGSDERK